MASKTLTYTHLIDGTPTDLDELPVFRSGDGLYGVRNSATLDVVVPGETLPDTLWEQVSTGTYQATIPGLTAGVEYDYVVRKVYEGAIEYLPGDFVAAETATGVHYSSVALLRLKLGETNAEAHAAGSSADLESTGVSAKIDAQEEEALDESDSRVNLKIMGAGIALPLDSAVTANTYVSAQIQRAATLYAAGYVLKFREDQAPPPTGTAEQPSPGDMLLAEGDAIMDTLVAAGVLSVEVEDDVAAGTFQFAEITRTGIFSTETTDENYRPLWWA